MCDLLPAIETTRTNISILIAEQTAPEAETITIAVGIQRESNEQVALYKAYRTEYKQRDPLSLISSISWLKGPIRSRGSRGYLINDRGRERSGDGCHCGAVPATGQGKWCRRMASSGVHNFRDFGRRPGVAQEGSASTRMPAE